MTDHDETTPRRLREAEQGRSSGSRERRSMGSYETGESSTAGRYRSSLAMTDSTLAHRSSEDGPADPHDISFGDSVQTVETGRRDDRKRGHRSHKNRSSGAFLLSGALDNSPRDAHKRQHTKKHHTPTGQDEETSRHAADQSRKTSTASNGVGGSRSTNHLTVPGSHQHDARQDTPTKPSPGTNNTMLDIDSAQIVNMALNLSESRRIAARRNVSQPLPPKLAPLPDSSVGGSLRQQLQQQRRTSRTVSPKPDRGSRVFSGQKLSSPLQTAFDPLDGSYRYHFSQSTLARAQKAKDYLELLFQHRRVLELVPPLKPELLEKITTASPPGSPLRPKQSQYFGSGESGLTLGRPYNPLQYIRNRKVRARERKAIDGEGQGFGDLTKVADWVDGVAKWAATGQSQTPGGTLLPPFGGAGEAMLHNSPSSNPLRSAAVSKPKRPRVDWVIDPADMIADVYWLEQGDNKKLVEDRTWHRVFPQDPEMYRPTSRQAEDLIPVTGVPTVTKKAETMPIVENAVAETNSPGAEHERVRKARQKLHPFRGRHHRHESSANASDVHKLRKGSMSDTSDSDIDVKPRRRARQDTITAGGKDVLEKQMLEMIAREHRESEAKESYELELQRTKSTNNGLITPERPRSGSSTGPSRGPSRRGSHGAEMSGSEEKLPEARAEMGSPVKAPRASLEVPFSGRRISVDFNLSQPPSPGIRPTDVGFVPALGMDMTPNSSRPGSPPRNPFTKVKSIFRDRSRERSADRINETKEEQSTSKHVDTSWWAHDTPPTGLSPVQSKTSVERKPSRSPGRKVVAKVASEGHKAKGSISSIRLRNEESSGLRNFLKNGPRIDSVLRSGVSKVGELIWRKDADAANDQSSSTSSSESEDEGSRGRSRSSVMPSRNASQRRNDETIRAKHYLDVMPTFQSSHAKEPAGEQTSISRPPSRSARFDMLKPPRIDVQGASPSVTPPRELSRTRSGSSSAAVSTSRSRKGSSSDNASTRLNHVLSLPEPFVPPHNHRARHLSASSSHGASPSRRHWSLSDGRSPSPRAQSLSQQAVLPTRLSRREVARLRAMILGSGIVATEIARRINEPRLLASGGSSSSSSSSQDGPGLPCAAAAGMGIEWADILRYCPDPQQQLLLAGRPLAQREVYPTAARILASSVQASGQTWHASADAFARQTTPALRRRVEGLRAKVAADMSGMTRGAADEADAVMSDLLDGQRLKVQRVVDMIDKLSRRRRRRFRWVRRAGWLGVEWLLVGFMWYVWFVVMIARVFWGVGSGVVAGVRWLLWL